VARNLLSREKSFATPPKTRRAIVHPEWLASVIEGEIVPRLLMHAVASRDRESMALDRWRPTSEDVSEFADLLIAHNAELALAYVQSWREQGAVLRTIYMELLAQTPSHLRRLRRDGRLGFARHALARYRLTRVVRRLRCSVTAAESRVAGPLKTGS
jgi:MerR family transcriptional regulator, light-induced transcriptional regulator